MKKVKLVFDYSAFVFVCDGCMGGMRLASKFWFLLRVNTKWKGAGVGGTAHSSRYVPSGLNDLYILALSTSTHLRDFPCVHLSSIWMNVRTLVRKWLYRSGITTERGDEGGGGSSAHSPTSAPRGFKGSNTLTPSRETCRKLEQHRITDGANGSSHWHQAVAWTIRSPLIASPIHITGVYVSPSEGEVEEFFHTLTQQDHYPPDEIHVYAGDFNAHVAEELEQHITIQERSTIPVRVGDCHRRHLPSPPDAAPITRARVSSQQRGRLLLRMLNITSILISNGRFETPDDPIHYTLQ